MLILVLKLIVEPNIFFSFLEFDILTENRLINSLQVTEAKI